MRTPGSMAAAEIDHASVVAEDFSSSCVVQQLQSLQINAASDFRYQRLDASKREIRLLELLPQEQIHAQGTIKCSIKHAYLGQTPSYTALSYTWGEMSDTVSIQLNNHYFEVSRSLFVTLEHLREDDRVTLWIDAICINQADKSEKGSQVAMMRDIYEQAKETIIWLGPAEGDSDLAMDKLIAVGDEALRCGIMALWTPFLDLDKWCPIAVGKRRSRNEGPLERLLRTSTLGTTTSATFPVQAIQNLLQRRWGSRSWVMQELAVSRRPVFVCGTKRLPADEMDGAVLLYEKLYEALKGAHVGKWAMDFKKEIMSANVPVVEVNTPLGGMLRVRRDYYRNMPTEKRPFRLDQLLLKGANNLHATDPRDKVYAFLGLSRDSEAYGIQPDYSKSCSELYVDVAKCLLEGDFGTNSLSICTQKNGLPGIPSWAPDWSLPVHDNLGSRMNFRTGTKIKQSLIFQHVNGRDILGILGSPFDKIAVVGPTYSPENSKDMSAKDEWAYNSEWIRAVEKILASAASAYDTPEKVEDAIWRTLVFDQEIGNGQIVRATDSGLSLYRLISLSFGKACNDPELLYLLSKMDPYFLGNAEPQILLDEDPRRWAEAQLFIGNMRATNEGRRTFVTSKGYIGLGPDSAQEGDEVAIIAGALVPYILHRDPDGCYRLLGDAYVHGIMDGEGLDGQIRVGLFPLC